MANSPSRVAVESTAYCDWHWVSLHRERHSAAESLVPGAQVATVARKHGVTRWQVYDWRRRLQRGRLSLSDSMAAMFAPLVVDGMPKTVAAVQPALAKLEIMVGDVVIRTEVEVEHLAGVILAMRASR